MAGSGVAKQSFQIRGRKSEKNKGQVDKRELDGQLEKDDSLLGSIVPKEQPLRIAANNRF